MTFIVIEIHIWDIYNLIIIKLKNEKILLNKFFNFFLNELGLIDN